MQILEQIVLGLGFKNGEWDDVMCLREIGMLAQSLLSIVLGLIIGGHPLENQIHFD